MRLFTAGASILISEEQQHFLDAIIEEPDDDTPRLIYADWLEEHGDPRGAFIRLQCEKAENLPSDLAQLTSEQEHQILRDHAKRWLEELGIEGGRKHVFDRGFVQHFEIKASDFLAGGKKLLRSTPLKWLRLVYLKGKAQKLIEAGLLAELQGFDLSGLKLPIDELKLILDSMPKLRRLRVARAKFQIDERFAEILLEAPLRDSLEVLDLRNSRVETDFYLALQRHQGLSALREIQLGNADLGGPRPKFLDKAKLPALETLIVDGGLRVADVEEFVSLGSLRKYVFNGNMPERGLRAMVSAGCFDKSEVISMNSADLTQRAGMYLLQANLANCRILDLRDNPRLETEFWQQLSKIRDALPNLEALVVNCPQDIANQTLQDFPVRRLAYDRSVQV